MGIGSVLGKIGKVGLGILGAGATGGASLIPSILGAVGQVAGGASQGRAAGRQAEAGINNDQDRLRLQAAQLLENALTNRGQLDINQREYGLRAPGMRAGNALRGDAMAGLQDAGLSGPITGTHGRIPQITGGLRPSLISANTRQLGQNMSRDALLQNMNGADTFQPLPPVNIPPITPTPQAGGFDTFLNTMSGIGTGTGAIQAALEEMRKRNLDPSQMGQVEG